MGGEEWRVEGRGGGVRGVEVEGWGVEGGGWNWWCPQPQLPSPAATSSAAKPRSGPFAEGPEGRPAGAGMASCRLATPRRNPSPSYCCLMLTMLLSAPPTPHPPTPGPMNPMNQPFPISFFNILSVTSSHWRKTFEMTTRDESHDKRSEETETNAGKRKLERTITDVLRGRKGSCARETQDG